MSPKYKLIYLDGRGLGEGIRYLLSYMDQDYEDVRVKMEEWPKLKPTTPFGKVPILEVDGRQLTQSLAILRYLGQQAGLGGSSEWENVQIDIIADTINDLRQPIYTFFMEKDPEVKKSKQEAFLKDTLPFYMNKLEAVAKENGGYLANKKLSWADFYFAASMEGLSVACEVPDVTADYPTLHALREKVFSLPQIKKWREKRPLTPW